MPVGVIQFYFFSLKLLIINHKDVQVNGDEATYYRNDQPSRSISLLIDSMKRISWSSVFAGVLITIVIQIALSLLGTGIGLSTINPKTEANSTDGLGISSAIRYIVSSLISLFACGWITGRSVQTMRYSWLAYLEFNHADNC